MKVDFWGDESKLKLKKFLDDEKRAELRLQHREQALALIAELEGGISWFRMRELQAQYRIRKMDDNFGVYEDD